MYVWYTCVTLGVRQPCWELEFGGGLKSLGNTDIDTHIHIQKPNAVFSKRPR